MTDAMSLRSGSSLLSASWHFAKGVLAAMAARGVMYQSPERLACHGQTHPDLWPSVSADRGDALSFKHRVREKVWTGTKSNQVFLH